MITNVLFPYGSFQKWGTLNMDPKSLGSCYQVLKTEPPISGNPHIPRPPRGFALFVQFFMINLHIPVQKSEADTWLACGS